MSSIKNEDQIPALEAQQLRSSDAVKTEERRVEQGVTREDAIGDMEAKLEGQSHEGHPGEAVDAVRPTTYVELN